MSEDKIVRRPLRSRDTPWAKAIARLLAARRVKPNRISEASTVFAAIAGACFVAASRAAPPWGPALYVAAAASIQLRLLCNLMDGMVAVEGGFRTKSGEVWNDLPDRLSDVLVLVPAGYVLRDLWWGGALGWAAGLLAVMTAYVRLLGGACGATQSFVGPMAKPHRMATMTLACIASAIEAALGRPPRILALALAIVALGSIITCIRRARGIVRELESKS